MPSYRIHTAHATYDAIVERGVLAQAKQFLPGRTGKVFIATDPAVWSRHGKTLADGLTDVEHHVLHFDSGEANKRFASVEKLAGEMVRLGADRSSLVIAFGGGIVNDMGGFLAAIFMRGIPVLQIPTTLLAQVDAAIGGKTGVNLEEGKNLIGAFHQPAAVLVDPQVLETLPEREFRAGLFEVVKYGVISSPELFELLTQRRDQVLAKEPGALDRIIAESVRIKAEVVSADERESDLRRILNFGHTVGHALEAETGYTRFLHGEAVAFGMNAATHLASGLGMLTAQDRDAILHAVSLYGPIPALSDISASNLLARLKSDKKTIRGTVHFVLPDRIGHVRIVSDAKPEQVRSAVEAALA